VSDEDAGRRIDDTIVRVWLLDRRTTASGVPLAENLLEVAVQKFMNPIGHRGRACRC
jgi:hypothetical protein